MNQWSHQFGEILYCITNAHELTSNHFLPEKHFYSQLSRIVQENHCRLAKQHLWLLLSHWLPNLFPRQLRFMANVIFLRNFGRTWMAVSIFLLNFPFVDKGVKSWVFLYHTFIADFACQSDFINDKYDELWHLFEMRVWGGIRHYVHWNISYPHRMLYI